MWSLFCNRNITPPNILSLIRIAIAILVIYLIHTKSYRTAAAWFLAGAFTDLLDGWLARKFRWHTNLGKKLDPLADKFLFVGTLGTIFFLGYIPGQLEILVITLFIFEAALLIIGILDYWICRSTTVLGANIFGKCKVWGEAGFILIFFGKLSGMIELSDPHFTILATYLLLITNFFAIFSIYGYLKKWQINY